MDRPTSYPNRERLREPIQLAQGHVDSLNVHSLAQPKQTHSLHHHQLQPTGLPAQPVGGGNRRGGGDLVDSISGTMYQRDKNNAPDWFKPYYPPEEHDNSHDSGTASTTLCSSTSSSPSPHTMLTHSSPNNPPPPLRGPPPPQPLPPLQLAQDYPRHPAELALIENSYAEIPYGSLPQNNFDGDQQQQHHQKQSGNSRTDWAKNNNFVNLNLGLEYPLRRDQNNSGQQQSAFRSSSDISPAAQRVGNGSTIVHLRDGPDGLHRIPEPRMAGLEPPPSPDFRCSEKGHRGATKSRRGRRTLMFVIIMAVAGVVYLGLGGLAGYYYGTSECQKQHSAAGVVGDATTTSSTTTALPGDDVNATSSSMPTTEVATTPLYRSTTTPTTVATSTTEPPPQYCHQAGPICTCGPFGGSSGQTFTDREDYHRLGNITGFSVKHNDYFISGLQIQYGNQQGREHGYTDVGFHVNVKLLKDEYITGVTADFALGKGYLSRLMVRTDRRMLGPYGGQGGDSFSINGAKLLYIQGRSGPLIDSLGFIFDRCL